MHKKDFVCVCVFKSFFFFSFDFTVSSSIDDYLHGKAIKYSASRTLSYLKELLRYDMRTSSPSALIMVVADKNM